MKIAHRVPPRDIQSDPITEEYQAEVDRSTIKLERAHAAALRRVGAASRRVERVERTSARSRNRARDMAVAVEQLEIRRRELADIERLMHAAGAGATHRGRKSYRPVPIVHGVNL